MDRGGGRVRGEGVKGRRQGQVQRRAWVRGRGRGRGDRDGGRGRDQICHPVHFA